MNRLDSRQVLRQLGPGVMYVSVEKPNGDCHIGTAFHAGDGWFVTAGHVILGNKIKKVGRLDITQVTQRTATGATAITTTWPTTSTNDVENISYHPDSRIDLAIFRCRGINAPEIQLELRTDAVAYNEFLLQEVLVLGYPPIPFSTQPFLVCVRADVSAVIEHYQAKRRHFILSGMARGGFSGGVALTLNYRSKTLGVITESLGHQDEMEQVGFQAVLSSEAILELLNTV